MIERYVSNHADLLEELISAHIEEYEALKKQPHDFGERLSLPEMEGPIREAVVETKHFLGMSEAPDVRWSVYDPKSIPLRSAKVGAITYLATVVSLLAGGSSLEDAATNALWFGLAFGGGAMAHLFREGFETYYHPGEQKIHLSDLERISLSVDAAHEYTHHLQNTFSQTLAKNRMLGEGHAIGVDGAVARLLSERYDNTAYTLYHLSRARRHLRDAYQSTRTAQGHEQKESPIPQIDRFFRARHHTLGYAMMAIAEARYGTKIYRDVLEDDFSFLANE